MGKHNQWCNGQPSLPVALNLYPLQQKDQVKGGISMSVCERRIVKGGDRFQGSQRVSTVKTRSYPAILPMPMSLDYTNVRLRLIK